MYITIEQMHCNFGKTILNHFMDTKKPEVRPGVWEEAVCPARLAAVVVCDIANAFI